MKYKHIAIGLIAVSLIALTFFATASAAVYYPIMTGMRAGKNFTFIIDTTSAKDQDGNEITNFGLYVDVTTIRVTVYDNKNNPIVINPDALRITPSAGSIIIQLVKQDGLPSHGSAVNAVGNLLGIYAGSTIFASGPGWGWGGVR